MCYICFQVKHGTHDAAEFPVVFLSARVTQFVKITFFFFEVMFIICTCISFFCITYIWNVYIVHNNLSVL